MIGDRVREAREALGMTQTDLARVAKDRHGWATCWQQTIARIETGDRALRLNEAAGLSLILGVSLDWLAGLDRTPPDARLRNALLAIQDFTSHALGRTS